MEAPQFFQAPSFCNSQFGHQIHYSRSPAADAKPTPAADNFAVEDLLDFSNDDVVLTDGNLDTVTAGNPIDSSALNTCNSSFLPDDHFSADLGVPYEDLAELEWLSNFVDDSFSSEELQKLQLISSHQTRPDDTSEFQHEPGRNNPIFNPDVSVPGKARSKRSRGNWTSRLLVLSPESDGKKACGGGEGRKCVHCATDKTPQWRTGPLGPKTLCNACGVRYKSGRLVPEYRPASSPTFVLTQHSNSHRKVMELRRQKEAQMAQQQFMHHHHQNLIFDVTNADDYLIQQHVGPAFRLLI